MGGPSAARPMVVLAWAERDEELDVAVELIARYLDELGEDLGFQASDASAEALRRHYPAPGGVLLAWHATRPVGVVAVRELSAGRFELKRLWVDPDHRGRGVGRALVGAVLERVDAAGGVEVVLDTLERLALALALYRALGFDVIEPYTHNPLPGALFLGKQLRHVRAGLAGPQGSAPGAQTLSP